MSWISKARRILLCVISLVLIIGIRTPLLEKPLFREEGNFASLIIYPLSTQIKTIDELGVSDPPFVQSCLLLVGRIDGKDILVRPGRNLMPYCLINKILHPLIKPYWQTLQTFDKKTKLARMIYLGISSIGLIASLILCYLVSLRLVGWAVFLPYLLFIYAGTTHLSVGSSIQPQLDGTIGVALLCSAYLMMYLSLSAQLKTKLCFFLLMMSGMLISFGKNEWPIVFLVALLGSMGFYFFAKVATRKFTIPNSIRVIKTTLLKKISAFKITPLLLGIMLGSILCILLSPADYFSGYSLMGNIAAQRYAPWHLVLSYLDILKPLSIFIGIAVGLTYLQFKFSLQVFSYLPFIYFLFALGITIGFIYSGYLGDGFPRYFAPSLMLIMMYCINLLPIVMQIIHRLWLVPILVILMLLIYNNYQIIEVYRTTSISITIPGDTNWKKNDLVRAAKLSNENSNQVYLIDASIVYYYPEANFISADMGKPAAEDLLKNYKNKILISE